MGYTFFVYSVHTFPHQKSLYSMFINIIIDQSWTHAISIRRSSYMHSQLTHHFASLDGMSLGAMSIHPYQAKDDSIWRWEKLFTLLRHNEYKTKQENQMLLSPTICEHCPTMVGLSLNNKHFGGNHPRRKSDTTRKYIFLDMYRKEGTMMDFVNWHMWFFALMN